MRTTPYPPGPGLPLHAPSVYSSTVFIVSSCLSRRCCRHTVATFATTTSAARDVLFVGRVGPRKWICFTPLGQSLVQSLDLPSTGKLTPVRAEAQLWALTEISRSFIVVRICRYLFQLFKKLLVGRGEPFFG